MTMKVHTANGGVLNLRASTSTSSALLATIPNGTTLEVTSVNSNWYQTTYNDKTGYVMAKYLISTSSDTPNRDKLQAIYNSLKETLNLIEKALS